EIAAGDDHADGSQSRDIHRVGVNMPGFGQTRYSLKLGPRQAAWVERSTNWRRSVTLGVRVADLPQGLLTPSPIEPNIGDVEALKTHLRVLIGLPEGPIVSQRSIVLVLPDLCVRALLLEVDAIPAKTGEREAFIRWRL